jgi:hypothetical protein
MFADHKPMLIALFWPIHKKPSANDGKIANKSQTYAANNGFQCVWG